MEVSELENKKEISHLKPKSKKEKKLYFKQLFKVTKLNTDYVANSVICAV
jgi:hypothetical protein